MVDANMDSTFCNTSAIEKWFFNKVNRPKFQTLHFINISVLCR